MGRKPKTELFSIDPVTGCWVWLLARCGRQRNYGSITRDGRSQLAHRYMYETLRRVLNEDENLDHLCRNTLCVNPMHMDIVTKKENNRRNIHTKLTEAQAAEIKVRGLVEFHKYLADEFGVSTSTISKIVTGKNWI